MPLPWARVSINQQPYKSPRVGDRRPDMPDSFQKILSGLASGCLQLGIGGTPSGFQTIRSSAVSGPQARSGVVRLGATDTLVIGSSTYGINSAGQPTINGVVQTTFQTVELGALVGVQSAGRYLIVAQVNFTTAGGPGSGGSILQVFVNGSAVTPNLVSYDPIAIAASDNGSVAVIGLLNLNAGDVVLVKSGTAGTAGTNVVTPANVAIVRVF
jgi:hypothetical protein